MNPSSSGLGGYSGVSGNTGTQHPIPGGTGMNGADSYSQYPSLNGTDMTATGIGSPYSSMTNPLGSMQADGTSDYANIEQHPNMQAMKALMDNFFNLYGNIEPTVGKAINVRTDLLSLTRPLTACGLNYMTQSQSYEALAKTRSNPSQDVHEVSSRRQGNSTVIQPTQADGSEAARNYNIRSDNRVKNLASKARSVTTYDGIINKYAQMYNVDPLLIKSVISKESNWNPNAGSGAGAVGLMQLMPATATSLGCKNRKDPEQNIKAGTLFLSRLLKRYDNDMQKALAAYNAGPGHVNDILNGTNNHGKNPKKIKDPTGIPRLSETQDYVPTVLGIYNELIA